MNEEDLEMAREAKRAVAERLLANPDVHAAGVGRRRKAGEKIDEYAIVVHVARKMRRDRVPPSRLLPTSVRHTARDGREVRVRVDVQEHAPPVPEGPNLSARVRPVPGGYSAGTGTLGGWVWDALTGQVVALSNEHVFGSVPGTPVTQPSLRDGGRPAEDQIARVLRAGTLDAAIAAPLAPAIVDPAIASAGPAVFGIAEAAIDMPVQKTGQTTGLTFGTVDLIEFDCGHHGSHADLWIDGGTADFSSTGDSGALYLYMGEGAPRVVGLHWGGSANHGAGHHIRAVFDDLNLAPLSAPLVPPPAPAPTARRVRPEAGLER
jgi:hypothetical protein